MRRDYRPPPLRRAEMAADPFAQFREWFDEAVRRGIPEPNAMSLATADAEGVVGCRTVLLKGFDARGFVFFTNYGSRKSCHIAANANVALLFPWVPLARQVEVAGTAQRISAAESLAYFASRPRDSRIAAWVSEQSRVVSSRSLLLNQFAKMKERFARGEIPLPDHWGGFRVVPRWVEFWQGGADRLHDRVRYVRQGGDWEKERLAP